MTVGASPIVDGDADPREPLGTLFRDLRSDPMAGLSAREAARRLAVLGPNAIPTRETRRWPAELGRQLVHPLALLLWAAAGLSWGTGSETLAYAILGVIVLNALLAFVQEQQAQRAVAALAGYLPETARVVRDGGTLVVPVTDLVPGDLVLIEEGDRVPADGRLVNGALEADASALTGESVPVERSANATDTADRTLDSPVLVFSGTSCLAGAATVLVHATGSRTEIGRIAALSGHVTSGDSPLERQVRRVAWLIAAVATGTGIAFVPLGMLAGLGTPEAFTFAIGLLVANVPEGLLPTITLALAGGVRAMARRGAVVKRLSAVETLGSTQVICTDKTGTLTQNRMRVVEVIPGTCVGEPDPHLGLAVAHCSSADLPSRSGDPTELALLEYASSAGAEIGTGHRESERVATFRFDPALKRMSTVDRLDGSVRVHVKGAPESVLPCCTGIRDPRTGAVIPMDATRLQTLENAVRSLAGRGLRVLAVAERAWSGPSTTERDEVERDLVAIGLVGLVDPPRPEVAGAVRACHTAGIRVHVVTGDNGRTAAWIARQVEIRADRIVDGTEFDAMTDDDLDALLRTDQEIVFSRATPEGKLRIADALRHLDTVVAMTGDGVNDAPALRRADIGVAMGVTGTEVARESATVVLTDDNFATIVAGVEEGRRAYANVRKFVLYIFAHAVPEVTAFLVFALAGGLIPLPLTVLQILAIDLGTETLPALALGREPAEPGQMSRPPRTRGEGVVTRRMLMRAWAVMGTVSALLALGAFFLVLLHAGWSPGDDTGKSDPLHHAYQQATTATFAAIVICQIGTAFAARTDRASLRDIGLWSNRLLLAGVVFELAFAAALIYVPALQDVFGTAALPWWVLAVMIPFPVLVWGADEIYRRRTATAVGRR